jgi:NTP pyrophosphatase (non-canonical NTP hydrolase)
VRDPVEDLVFGLLAEAFELGHEPSLARVFESLERDDFQLVPKDLGLLRSHARDLEDLEEALGDTVAQLVEVRELAGFDQLFELGLEALAYALDL